MKFLDWLSLCVENNVVNSDIIVNSLKKIENDYYVTNISSTSNLNVKDSVSLRRKSNNKIYAHLVIENNKLYVVSPNRPKSELDSSAEILPKVLEGGSIKTRSGVYGKEITIENIDRVVDALEAVLSIK